MHAYTLKLQKRFSSLPFPQMPRLSSIFLFCLFSFLYAPIAILIVFSFNSMTFPAPWHHFTLHWYRELFSQYDLWIAFFHSLIVAMTSSVICLLLSVCFLYFLAWGGKAEKTIPLFYGNLIIPEIVLAIGLVSYFSVLQISLGLFTIIIAHSILGLGFIVPILYVRYRDIDHTIFEASLALGATVFQTFRQIILPLLAPTLIAGTLMLFVLSFDDFILAYFCCGSTLQTLPIFLISSIRYGISPVINALATILFVFTISLVGLFCSLNRRTKVF